MKKRLVQSFLMFASALLLLFGVLFAWFSLTPTVDIQDFLINVNKYEAELKLEIKKNDDNYTVVASQEDIYQIFYNTVPNDYLYFRLTIINKGNNPVTADIWMKNVISDNDPDYDMCDVFYLADGKIIIDSFDYPVLVNSEETIAKHNQTLHLYRLNNILDNDFGLQLADDLAFSADQLRILEFVIVYDYTTEAKGYEEGILSLAALNIIFNTAGE
ncbi:MAG: hypothetical protein PHV87_06675 [Bacilli bacterium]|nr:hypothetical protein [Bacilli bacterium]